MTGRQVILTNKAFTLDELYKFMDESWNKEEYNEFTLGSPYNPNVKKYIILPATDRFLVFLYPRAAGGLFSKTDKIVLCTANSPEGMREALLRSVPTRSVILGAVKMGKTMSMENERKGPAEEVLQKYTAYLKSLLEKAGYLK